VAHWSGEEVAVGGWEARIGGGDGADEVESSRGELQWLFGIGGEQRQNRDNGGGGGSIGSD